MENFNIPDNDHIKKLLQDEDFTMNVALSENKNMVVGELTAYILHQYYSVK
jgi:hypothetical protein